MSQPFRHEQWFPIRYPDQFFVLATSMHSRLQSECLVDPRTDTIAALLVWRQTPLVCELFVSFTPYRMQCVFLLKGGAIDSAGM